MLKGIAALSDTEEKIGPLSGQLQNVEIGLWKDVKHKKLASKITNTLFKPTKA